MARNKMEDLRDHLFEVIERVKDDEEDFDLERARVINSTAKRLIESAKVEVDLLKVVSGAGGEVMPSTASAFFPQQRQIRRD